MCVGGRAGREIDDEIITGRTGARRQPGILRDAARAAAIPLSLTEPIWWGPSHTVASEAAGTERRCCERIAARTDGPVAPSASANTIFVNVRGRIVSAILRGRLHRGALTSEVGDLRKPRWSERETRPYRRRST